MQVNSYLNKYIELEPKLNYIPIVSTITSLITLTLKFTFSSNTSLNPKVSRYLGNVSTLRRIVLLFPGVGNIVIVLRDITHSYFKYRHLYLQALNNNPNAYNALKYGVIKNHSFALRAIRSLAENHSVRAMEILGEHLYKKHKVSIIENISQQNDPKYWLSLAALQGSAKAMYLLSKWQMNQGELITSFWLNSSANSGDVDAMYKLGLHYRYGSEIIKKDVTLAGIWLQKAAAKHHPKAETLFGKMLIKGKGVLKNSAQGYELLESAASKNHVPAMMELAYCYQDSNNDVSLKWALKAAQNDSVEGMTLAGKLLTKADNAKDFKEGMNLLELAAKKGCTVAQFRLSSLYRKGTPFLAKNPSKYIFFLQKSAEGGDEVSQTLLGEAYYYGSAPLIKKDLSKAAHWFSLGAANGDESSMKYLTIIYKTWGNNELADYWKMKLIDLQKFNSE